MILGKRRDSAVTQCVASVERVVGFCTEDDQHLRFLSRIHDPLEQWTKRSSASSDVVHARAGRVKRHSSPSAAAEEPASGCFGAASFV